MRVLQAMAGAEFGGAEAFFERLVIALHNAGLEQRVLIRENPRRAELLRGQLPLHNFPQVFRRFAVHLDGLVRAGVAARWLRSQGSQARPQRPRKDLRLWTVTHATQHF